MKLCERCSVLGCCLDYLGTSCENARNHECPDIQPTNFEKMANFTDIQVAEVISLLHKFSDSGIFSILDWLRTTEDVFHIIDEVKYRETF